MIPLISQLLATLMLQIYIQNFIIFMKHILCKKNSSFKILIFLLKYRDYLFKEWRLWNQHWLFIYRNRRHTAKQTFVKENCVGPAYSANYGALDRFMCRPQVQSDFGLVGFVSISDRARLNTTRSYTIPRDSRKI